ncbi:epoxyqueuosine reductase [Lachnoclostridium phytofermentans]|uniref:Fe-S protein-like protein n=1 Tax=Lachnoclostridium phytofermentans (strain ATCC 700394 / DSM 18823 / ISDg) TaxID=357809 RepID=A9KMH5_LACP7|nr:epoxyqueuosine reductase [Lachnoclostridium phytofermentans]ABX42929.1 Fe-S protein-like protein [Lachnoclostridium phytofermentans ISDg]
MLINDMADLLKKQDGLLYGFTDISYSEYSREFKSALVLAMPYESKLTLEMYSEKRLEQEIQTARQKLNTLLQELEKVLYKNQSKYFIPPVAQKNETDLIAPFSFKYAAIQAGLGWIGKNDVLITKQYGPRVRLSAVLIDNVFEYGEAITKSHCPHDCNLCVGICPYKALKGVDWEIDRKRCEIIDYSLCNQKRSLSLEKLGRKNACGLCMVVCPYGLEEA